MSFRITVTVNSDREEDFEKMLRNIEEIAKDIRANTANAGATIKSEFTPPFVAVNPRRLRYGPNQFWNRQDARGELRRPLQPGRSFNLGHISLQSRAEAEEVLDSLIAVASSYGYATIADLKNVLGFHSYFSDTKNGWEHFRDARIERVEVAGNGWEYLLKLPTDPQPVAKFIQDEESEEVKAVNLPPIPGHEFVLANQDDADKVLDTMKKHIEDNGFVSMARLFELCGIQHEHRHNLWGWKNLGEAGILQTRDGYQIDLPRPVQL